VAQGKSCPASIHAGNPIQQSSLSWITNSCLASHKIPCLLMKSEGSFSCSKELTTETAGKICYTSSNPLVFRPILVLVLFSHLCLGLPTSSFHSGHYKCYFLSFPCLFHMSHTSHPPLVDHINNILWMHEAPHYAFSSSLP